MPVDITAYQQTVYSAQIFSDYLENRDSAHCLITQCSLLHNCGSAVASTEFIWTDTSKIYVNTDPREQFYFEVCLQCSNRNITVVSERFKIEANCTNNIMISLPVGFEAH
jgi:UTP:GlnB (protein PII) uridylyltransferase